VFTLALKNRERETQLCLLSNFSIPADNPRLESNWVTGGAVRSTFLLNPYRRTFLHLTGRPSRDRAGRSLETFSLLGSPGRGPGFDVSAKAPACLKVGSGRQFIRGSHQDGPDISLSARRSIPSSPLGKLNPAGAPFRHTPHVRGQAWQLEEISANGEENPTKQLSAQPPSPGGLKLKSFRMFMGWIAGRREKG